MSDRPVLIDLDGTQTGPSPADAPPVAEPVEAPSGQAMQTLATLAARPRSRLAAWFWQSLLALVIFVAGIAAWDFVNGLLARSPVLASIALFLLGAFLIVCLVIIVREVAALSRLRRVDRFHAEAADLRASGDLTGAREFATRLIRFYAGRTDVQWGASRLEDRVAESFDAETILGAVEDQLLAPLDAMALREVEAAARQVATVTALVPLAFADVIYMIEAGRLSHLSDTLLLTKST